LILENALVGKYAYTTQCPVSVEIAKSVRNVTVTDCVPTVSVIARQ